MSLFVPHRVLTEAPLAKTVARVAPTGEWSLWSADLTPDVLDDLTSAAAISGDKHFSRSVQAIRLAREGDFSKRIPNLAAAPEVILAFLRQHLIDGWVYRTGPDGQETAFLVTDVLVQRGQASREPDKLAIHLLANGGSSSLNVCRRVITFTAKIISRRRARDLLLEAGLRLETPELKAAYTRSDDQYARTLREGFAQQFLLAPGIGQSESVTPAAARRAARVVHDISPEEIPDPATHAPSVLFGDAGADTGDGKVPTSPVLRVFDLARSRFQWVSSTDLAPYAYPLIAGRSRPGGPLNSPARKVTLVKGHIGSGYALVARRYAERVGRPLYSVDYKTLGCDVEGPGRSARIVQNLRTVFAYAARWNAVLVIDTVGIFNLERCEHGQWPLAAAFVEGLEQYEGRLFLTTYPGSRELDAAIMAECGETVTVKSD